MSCVMLIGGVIGCGKTTLINHLEDSSIFISNNNKNHSKIIETEVTNKLFCRIIFDELCSIEAQAEMMNSLKGWKCFRSDLLMASEHFIGSLLDSATLITHGPLTERSQQLLEKLKDINRVNCTNAKRDFVFITEDNFYYRSMRYEWFQLSRRANIGFCELFLDCPLDVAIYRNCSRGYNIPEEKIKRMKTFLEYPEPEKYKWEKFSITLDTSGELKDESLKQIIGLFEEAAKNPAEMMIMSDKIEAQSICSKNVVHQADRILRKSVSKAVSLKRGQILQEGEERLASFMSFIVGVRQRLLSLIKSGEIEFPRRLLEDLKSHGVEAVQKEFEEAVTQIFREAVDEKLIEPTMDRESQILLTLKELNLNSSSEM